ncbi:hypothetical protein JCM10213_006873, partial [Rhodosporidiobolus nylandii]
TMSKLLEAAVEEWLRWWAEQKEQLPSLQFGGRKGRSVEDAVMWVVEKTKERWRKGEVVVGLAIDARRAFPSVRAGVLLDMLLKRLGEVAHPLLPWLRSFLSDRSVRLIIEGELSSLLDGNCGLPQGSPLSPLLYTLYNAGLLESLLSDFTAGVGFVDDVFTLAWGKTVGEAVGKLQARLKRAERWGRESATEFEPEKSGWMVFSQGKKWMEGIEKVEVKVNGVVVPRKEVLRFLGVPLDGALRWGLFWEERVAAGEKALNGLRAVVKATKGADLVSTRALYRACVLPRLDYLSAIWWGASGWLGAIQRLDRVQRKAAQLVSGALRSTSLPALEVSSFLLPTRLRLDRLAYRAAVRLHTLPEHHPLHPFIRISALPATHSSPIPRLLRAFPSLRTLTIECIDPRLAEEPGT